MHQVKIIINYLLKNVKMSLMESSCKQMNLKNIVIYETTVCT